MKKLMAMLLLLLCAPASAVVYVGAHPDDIELFMNRNASRDVYIGYRTIFILLTAGDNGYRANIGDNASGVPYYRARLRAHEKAVRFWASLSGAKVPNSVYSTEVANGHAIERVDISPNVTLYNLNLPDGAGQGIDGQSLSNLLNGQVATISAIDGSSSYTLNDLTATIRTLIAENHTGATMLWVNYQNENTSQNTDDHPDHTSAGRIVTLALSQDARFACAEKDRFLDYVVGTLPQNMTSAETYIHIGTWGAVNSGLVDNGNQNTWSDNHNVFLGRQYVTAEAGTGACSL